MPRVVFPQRFNASAGWTNLCPVINAAEGRELGIFVVAPGADCESHHRFALRIVAHVWKKVSSSFSRPPLPAPIGINRQAALVDYPLRLVGLARP